MRFKGYTDEDFTVRVPNTPVRGFEVTINPESFERTLGVKTEKDKTARSGNSSGHSAKAAFRASSVISAPAARNA